MKIGIYVHWPWCQSKCYYCDFNSYPCSNDGIEGDYVKSLIKELKIESKRFNNSKVLVSSIYFGGGTPSLMNANYVSEILNTISDVIHVSEECEKTIECNPCSIDEKKIENLKKLGFNRISIGVQSFDNDRLKFLGRRHSAQQAYDAINSTKKFFDNISIDMIYGTPEQKIKDWEKELEKAVSFNINHISAYQLSIEDGTKLQDLRDLNIFKEKPEESQREFFDNTRKILGSHGYDNYETSNFAKNGKVCQHNVNIWEYNPYLGLGAGAHSRLFSGKQYIAKENIKKPAEYVAKIKEGEIFYNQEVLSTDSIAIEMLLLGLRLRGGLDLESFKSKTGGKLLDEFVRIDKMNEMIKQNILQIENNHLKLTQKSYHLLDEVINELLK